MSALRAALSAVLSGVAFAAATLGGVVSAAGLPGGGSVARADVEFSAEFGFGSGRHVQDAPTPFRVALRSRESGPVTVTVRVRTGDAIRTGDVAFERRVALPPGQVREEWFFVPGPSSFGEEHTVTVTTEPRVPVRSGTRVGDRGSLSATVGRSLGVSTVVPSGAHVIGLCGTGAAAVAAGAPTEIRQNAFRQVDEHDRIEFIEIPAGVFPYAPIGLSGLETLLLLDPDAETVPSERVADAILDWVALGGRLVIAPGERATQFAAGPLGRALALRDLRSRTGDYTAVARSFGADPQPDAPPVPGPLWTFSHGLRDPADERSGADSGGSITGGAAGEFRYGSGRIVLLSFRLDRLFAVPPRSPDAPVSASVLGLLLRDLQTPGPKDLAEGQGWIQPWNVGEPVQTLLRGNAFEPPSPLFVLLGLALYVLVVGPLDWVVLRRRRKERWTTVTFVCSVTAFTALAWVVSLLLFGAEAQSNRVVFVRLTESGRPGRELHRTYDVAGHYLPGSGILTSAPPPPAAILGARLPGVHAIGSFGTPLEVLERSAVPLAPQAEVDIAFRSQRLLTTVMTGTTGRTVEIVFDEDDTVVVTNTLPVALADAWVARPRGGAAQSAGDLLWYAAPEIPSGATVTLRATRGRPSFTSSSDPVGADAPAAMTTAFWTPDKRPPAGLHGLLHAGIAVAPPGPGASRSALFVARASESPFPLGDEATGTRHVVVVKEVRLP